MENKVEEQPTQECSNVQNTSGREPVTRSPFTVYLDGRFYLSFSLNTIIIF